MVEGLTPEDIVMLRIMFILIGLALALFCCLCFTMRRRFDWRPSKVDWRIYHQ